MPLALEEVALEVSFAQATHLGHTEFGKAPERFNIVHSVFHASELIVMVMHPMIAVIIEDQAIIRPPTVRVKRSVSQNQIFDHEPQRVARADINNFDIHTTLVSANLRPKSCHQRHLCV